MSNILPDRSIALVYRTRPEQIKLSVLTTMLGDQARLIHTGQHHDPALTEGRPHLQLAVGGAPRGVQIGAELTAADHDSADHTQTLTLQQSSRPLMSPSPLPVIR